MRCDLVSQFQTSFFSFDEYSNSVKIGDFFGFLNNLTLRNIIFGNGLATYYFAIGRGIYSSHTENTFLDLIRYLGLFITLIFFFYLLYPRYENKKKVVYFINCLKVF